MGVLQATNGSANMTSVLVSLAGPRYDATRRTLTFQVRLTWPAWPGGPCTTAAGCIGGQWNMACYMRSIFLP